jgi:hypothetical protein
MTLVDLARALEDVAGNLRFCHEAGEYYDPHGITWLRNLEGTIEDFLDMVHKDYRKNILNRLNEKFKEIK